MIKDDMSDDAAFDAFLKGEGALARQLQALAQPSPSPALDAAILAHARTALGDARPAAANDAAPARHAPPRALSWRWRVPAGIAATLLVGVIARQSFESDQGQPRYDAPVAEAPVPAAADAAERAAAVPAHVAQSAAAPVASVAPPAVEQKRAAGMAAKPALKAAAPPMEPVPAPPPAPASPAPAMDALIEKPARVSVTGSRIAAPASEEVQVDAPRAAQRADDAASAQKPMRAPARRYDPAGLANAAAPADSAAAMLERVERLLLAGDREAAAEAWEALQRTYPDYPVPDAVREKLRERP